MLKRRVYSAKLRRLVLQLVNYQASLSCGNHCHGVDLHVTLREVKSKNTQSISHAASIQIVLYLQHLHSSISLASARTSWDWESACPRTADKENGEFVIKHYNSTNVLISYFCMKEASCNIYIFTPIHTQNKQTNTFLRALTHVEMAIVPSVFCPSCRS